ncbi:hypothetical protein BH11BAC5_BH11BAC5_08790 [soil metagenome]|jgi:hypothetical protein
MILSLPCDHRGPTGSDNKKVNNKDGYFGFLIE